MPGRRLWPGYATGCGTNFYLINIITHYFGGQNCQWSKLPVFIVHRVLDNKAINIEVHWKLIFFSYTRCGHCTVLHFWPPVIMTTKMVGNDIHEINDRTTTGLLLYTWFHTKRTKKKAKPSHTDTFSCLHTVTIQFMLITTGLKPYITNEVYLTHLKNIFMPEVIDTSW